jgi:hypothetical protein
MSLRKEILAHQKPDKNGRYWKIPLSSMYGTYLLPCTIQGIVDSDKVVIEYWNPDLEESEISTVERSSLWEETDYTPEMMRVAFELAGDAL